jgi:hypothetical protein
MDNRMEVAVMAVICSDIANPAVPAATPYISVIAPTRKGIMNRLPSPTHIAAIIPTRSRS